MSGDAEMNTVGSPSPTVRQRKPETVDRADKAELLEQPKKGKKKSNNAGGDVEYENRWLDLARVLTFLFFASSGLSYLVSSGESFFWSMKVPPKYLRTEWWKNQWNGPLYLTPEELRAYDGSDPTKPIYLAINHTIYDVTAGSRMYGPGGSYNVFAGVDASRGFVTGCFLEDQTPDMRGVEEMFLPLDDPAVDRHFTTGELKNLRAQERRKAEKKVYDGLKHWVDFFSKSNKYSFVGYVKRPADWLDKEPVRGLCEQAAKGRKPRKIPEDRKQS